MRRLRQRIPYPSLLGQFDVYLNRLLVRVGKQSVVISRPCPNDAEQTEPLPEKELRLAFDEEK
jgi:hypothetical protein